MGCTQSGPENSQAQHNKEIGKYIEKDREQEKQVKKLLLLGSGSSGKSTLFKQIKRIHGVEVEPAEKNESKHVIRMNLVQGMLVLLQQAHKLFEADPIGNKKCQIPMDDMDTLSAIQHLVEFNGVTFQDADNGFDGTNEHDSLALTQLGENLSLLWENEGVIATFNRRQGLFSFPDNLDYFFDKVEQVMDPNYIPDDEDVLKVRIRTTGMITYEYKVGPRSPEIHIIDVGGQRNERKKWIHHFSGVFAVIFVAALNHYTAVLFEDEHRNAMHEAVELFHEIRNSKWFHKLDIILFLNKKDLFEECVLQGKSMSICFTKEAQWGVSDSNTMGGGIEEEKELYANNRFPIWNPHEFADHIEYTGPPHITTEEAAEFFKICVDSQTLFIQHVFEAQSRKTTSGRTWPHVITATDQDFTKRVYELVQSQVILGNMIAGGIMPIHMA